HPWPASVKALRLFAFGVNHGRLQEAIRDRQAPVSLVESLQEADMVVTSRSFYRRGMGPLKEAEARSLPLYVLRSNTLPQMYQFLQAITTAEVREEAVEAALKEVEQAAARLQEVEGPVELSPQTSFVRRLQHQLAEQLGLATQSQGRDAERRVTIFRQG
ncbi:MAG: R3H domain-containing nucleic acid-binding protein, partial [Chloroflexota bacterium]